MSGFRSLSVAAALGVYLLIVLGGVVRVSGAGLGCPDWPLCHGKVVPPLERTALIEYSHRLVVSAVGLLVLATALVAWRRFRRERWIIIPAGLALLLLFVQSGLGAITVMQELPANIVTAHLGLALTFFACALIAALSAQWRVPLASQPARLPHDALGGVLAGALVATFLLMLMGAYIGSSGAGLACPDWPLCHDRVLPPRDWYIYANFTHRLLAVVASALIFATFALAWRRRAQGASLLGLAGLAALLVGVQIVIGALNVWLDLPAAVVVLHLANGTLIWATLVTMAFFIVRQPLTEPGRPSQPEASLV